MILCFFMSHPLSILTSIDFLVCGKKLYLKKTSLQTDSYILKMKTCFLLYRTSDANIQTEVDDIFHEIAATENDGRYN